MLLEKMMAIHEQAGTFGSAFLQLETAYFIAVWAYKRYDDESFIPKEIEIPNIEETNRKPEQIAENSVPTRDVQKPNQISHWNAANNPETRTGTNSPRQPGDVNKNKQELINKTQHENGNNPHAKIWIVQCTLCNFVYGINGFDFHIRKCPDCQNGRKGEPIEGWENW